MSTPSRRRALLDPLVSGAAVLRAGMVPVVPPHRYLSLVRGIRADGGVHPLTGMRLATARAADGVAVHDDLGSQTWADLDRSADALACALARLGGGRGRPVAVMCRNHRHLVTAVLAATRSGADTVLMNTGFAAPALGEVIAREGVEIVVHDLEFSDVVEAAAPAATRILAWDRDEAGTRAADRRSIDDLVAEHRGRRAPRPAAPGRIVLLTSGTTGAPKGARRSGGSGAGSLGAMFERVPWRAGENVVIAAPMFHAWGFGQMAIAMTVACTMVLTRRFDPETTLRLARDHAATGIAAVPVMVERIVDLPPEILDRHPLPHLRFVTLSGSKLRADIAQTFQDRFGDCLHNSFNATEAGLISIATPADLRAAPDTAGRPLRGCDVAILDDDGQPLPTGEIGRIGVASASHFDGYTSPDGEVTLVGGRMVSGDLGRFDDEGRLYVVGRDDEMIVSGGENVYPAEVERAIETHAAVHECAVVGVDDHDFGQRLEAWVVRRDGASVDADAVRTHVRESLAGYKVPRVVRFVDELPRTATGKVLKRVLADSAGEVDRS